MTKTTKAERAKRRAAREEAAASPLGAFAVEFDRRAEEADGFARYDEDRFNEGVAAGYRSAAAAIRYSLRTSSP